VGRMNYAQHPPAAPTDGRTRVRLSPIASIARIDVKHVEIHKSRRSQSSRRYRRWPNPRSLGKMISTTHITRLGRTGPPDPEPE